MKYDIEITDDNMFELCANKSLEEINAMPKDSDMQAQAIRYYFSRLLMNYPEEEPLKCNIIVETDEDQGLSDNEPDTM